MVLLGAVVGAGVAAAGSADDPEITDDTGDIDDPAVDVDRAWLHGETDTTVEFTVQVVDLSQPSGEEAYHYHVHFVVQTGAKGLSPEAATSQAGVLFHAIGVVNADGSVDGVVQEWIPQGNSGYWDTVTTTGASADYENDRITIDLPRHAIAAPDAGSRLSGFYVHAYAGDAANVTTAQTNPDSAFARDATFELDQDTRDLPGDETVGDGGLPQLLLGAVVGAVFTLVIAILVVILVVPWYRGRNE